MLAKVPFVVPCKKEKKYWKKVWRYFHEHRKFKKWNIWSDCNSNSLNRRWTHIQTECNKFNDAYDHIKTRRVALT